MSDYRGSNTNMTAPLSQPSVFGTWVLGVTDKTAYCQGKPRDNSFMDGCFACHSLRAPLTDGID
ncbi:MAG: hypothetical protein HRU22_14545 [Gammaproteobacteria bacterium]|nr:hypothetical protein [Gammaproteobacteria bacterium]